LFVWSMIRALMEYVYYNDITICTRVC
jgi:hypothetical protein